MAMKCESLVGAAEQCPKVRDTDNEAPGSPLVLELQHKQIQKHAHKAVSFSSLDTDWSRNL